MRIAVLHRSVLASLSLMLVVSSLYAQVPVTADRPAPAVGDVWKYRTIDLWNNSELSTSRVELVEIQPERFLFRFALSTAPDITTISNNRDMHPCRTMKDSLVEVCVGAFKFPLRVGDKHQYERLPWPSGEGYTSQACEVKSQESVKVAAGAFDAFRIECTGTYTRVFGGNFNGRVDETYWYAPKANRVVLSNLTDYRSGGGVFNRRRTELVEHLPK